MINANQPKVQHQPCISSAGLTQGHQPVHRCALAWQGVDHRTAPAGKKKSDGRESPQLAKRPHDKSEPSDNRDLRPPTSSGTSAHVALHHNRTGTGRAGHCGPIKAPHTSGLPSPGPFPTSSSRELIQPMVQCKVKAAITTYQRREKEKCVSSCDSASCSTNGTKVASSPFLIFGTPRRRYGW